MTQFRRLPRIAHRQASAFGVFTTPDPALWVIADGTNPRATEVPTYDIRWDDTVPFYPPLSGLWQADPREITLTVRDRAGASVSSSQLLLFNAQLSNESRAKCPPVLRGIAGDLVLHDVRFKATNKALTARIRCPTITDCAGTLQLDRAFSGRRRHAKPVLIGSTTLYVTGHRAATVAARLTAIGHALLTHGNPLVAIAQLTIVRSTSRTIRHSLKVTLIGKRKRR